MRTLTTVFLFAIAAGVQAQTAAPKPGVRLDTSLPSTIVAGAAPIPFTVSGGKSPHQARPVSGTLGMVIAPAGPDGFTVRASQPGQVMVQISDAAGNTMPHIPVTILADKLATTMPSLLAVRGTPQVFTITGGKPPYTVRQAPGPAHFAVTPGNSINSFSILGLIAGPAQAIVTDSAGNTLPVALTVK